MEQGEQKVSKYSSGINIIIRLDQLWKDTHNHSRSGRYNLWNLDLDRIWLELSRDYGEENDEYATLLAKFNDFEEDLENHMPFGDDPPSGFKELSPDQVKNRNEIYKILMDKQQFLARLENKLGKGTTFDDGDEDDFD